MKRENNYTDDLDYLSQQGFEKIPLNTADLDDLTKRIKARSFSYNSGSYFGFICLMMGVFIGASLFFIMDEQVSINPSTRPEPAVTDTSAAITEKITPPIVMDTLTVIKENFVNPYTKTKAVAPAQAAESVLPVEAEPVASIPEKPIDISLFNKGAVEENKLKFMANAPVVYIHDLKVTNYTLLYFRKNRFVKFSEQSGLSADYASRAGNQNGAHTKQAADYFLHEELAQALLYFKKGKYDQCIAALNNVSAYNDADINCDFYLAMCYYYKHNYQRAIALFDACSMNLNNTFFQEAMYYKAVALFDAGNKTEALHLFKQITEEDGFYAEKAGGYLQL